MERFEHIAMVSFLILGLAMVRLMTNMTSLVAKDIIAEDLEEEYGVDGARAYESHYDCSNVEFYWVHTIFTIITFFTIILFWWNCYPLNRLDFFPDEKWSLFTYLLFLAVPILMFMVCETLAPSNHRNLHVDMKRYWYRYHKIILGLAWTLQCFLILNLLVFFGEPLDSLKVIGRFVMLAIMAPMIFSKNHRLHEGAMIIFFVGFIYTILKYHLYS
jgi:hypothetical protein